jgi:hypothetical protein
MEKDERLEELCREFPTLEDGEKDYILGVSQALSFATSIQRKWPENEKPDKDCKDTFSHSEEK